MKRKNAGFTLAELLIVVAIIAVLVSVAIPVFTGQLERSREAVDFANVRSAYTALMATVIEGDGTAQYDGARIRQTDGTYRVVVKPLKQKLDGWSTKVEGMTLAGIPSEDWDGSPRADGVCSITYYPNLDRVNLIWGSRYSYMTLKELRSISNDKRVKEDQKTLEALGKAVLSKGWTISDLKENLVIYQQGNGYRIADYYQLKDDQHESAGFKITSKAGGELEALLLSLGFDPGVSEQTPAAGYSNIPAVDTTCTNKLFVSNELGTNMFHNYAANQTKRSIIIEDIHTDSLGRITQFVIYTKAMDNEANMNEQEKAKFRMTIRR